MKTHLFFAVLTPIILQNTVQLMKSGDQFTVLDQGDLVSNYLGGTTSKTRKTLQDLNGTVVIPQPFLVFGHFNQDLTHDIFGGQSLQVLLTEFFDRDNLTFVFLDTYEGLSQFTHNTDRDNEYLKRIHFLFKELLTEP